MNPKDKRIKELERENADINKFVWFMAFVLIIAFGIMSYSGHEARNLEQELQSCQEKGNVIEHIYTLKECGPEKQGCFPTVIKYTYNLKEFDSRGQNCFPINSTIICERGLVVKEYKILGEKCIWGEYVMDYGPLFFPSDYDFNQLDGKSCLINLQKVCEVIK